MEYDGIMTDLKMAADAYMDGTATPEQEQWLRGILRTADPADMPEDLKALRTMLSAAGDLGSLSFDTEGLADTCRRSGRKRPAALGWAGAIAVAASVVVAVCLSAPEKQEVFGYDIYGRPVASIDQALENIGSMNLLSELEDSMTEAEKILNQLVGEQ